MAKKFLSDGQKWPKINLIVGKIPVPPIQTLSFAMDNSRPNNDLAMLVAIQMKAA